jgi:hypothetical protein
MGAGPHVLDPMDAANNSSQQPQQPKTPQNQSGSVCTNKGCATLTNPWATCHHLGVWAGVDTLTAVLASGGGKVYNPVAGTMANRSGFGDCGLCGVLPIAQDVDFGHSVTQHRHITYRQFLVEIIPEPACPIRRGRITRRLYPSRRSTDFAIGSLRTNERRRPRGSGQAPDPRGRAGRFGHAAALLR